MVWQLIILCWVIVNFFFGLWTDFHGYKGGKPHGFVGAMATVFATAFMFLCCWMAGAFSRLF